MKHSDTVTITLPTTTCYVCGNVSWNHVNVLGAVGTFCRPCGESILPLVQLHNARQDAAMLAKGVITIPRPRYDHRAQNILTLGRADK